MIVKFQRPIEIINNCQAIYDEDELKEAIIWYSSRPVTRIKTVYMHGEYPAVSIHEQKIHIHRLLMMYWEKRQLDTKEFVHHKNENKLCALRENLELMSSSIHQSHHSKGRIFSKEHREKIAESNRRRKRVKKHRINLPVPEIMNMVADGMSISYIAKHFKVDRSTIRSRIHEHPHLLNLPGEVDHE
ncbi:hypothetical protein SAMN05518848_104192 [Paenibacillus sp. PDC88]|nr:hypothetical protein SAMN05518848_104192 [Paenibacillus sp. PDC88]